MKKGSYQPGQSPGRGGVGRGEDKALSVGKEKELGKCRQVEPERLVCLCNQQEGMLMCVGPSPGGDFVPH